jgi:PAS domain S-box-containing protein
MGEGFILATPDGRVTFGNPAAEEILGTGPGELAGRSLTEFCDVPPLAALLGDGQAARGPRLSSQLAVRRPDGATRTVAATFTSRVDLDPGVDGVLVVLRDATDLLHADEAIRQSEARFRAVAEHVSDITWTLSLDMRFTYVSPAVERVRGFTVEEARGQTMEQVLTPGSLEVATRALAESVALEAGPGRAVPRARVLELEQRRKDGSTVWTENAITVMRDPAGRPVGLVGVTRDVTRRRRAEQAVKEGEARFRAVFNLAGDAIFVVGPDGGFLDVNPAGCAQTGYGREELLRMGFLDVVSPQHADQARRCLLGEGAGRVVESRHRTRSGAELDVEVSYAAAELDGQPSVVVISRDVTARHRLEEEARQAHKSESLVLLAAGLAHDFGNLVTGILANVEFVRDAVEGPGLQGALADAGVACRRAKVLTQELLTYARGGEPARQVVDADHLLREVSAASLLGPAHRVVVRAHHAWPVEVDVAQVGQVLQNLVLNARQAMPLGGAITLSTRNVCQAGKRYVRVSVTDTGVGIPERDLPRIFDPYFTTKAVGSGLGLPVADALVRRHGGRVQVESVPGMGSTFHVFLPAVAPPPVDAGARPADIPAVRVLVVDTDQGCQGCVVALLAQDGHDAAGAADGDRARLCLQRARDEGNPFRVVLVAVTAVAGEPAQGAAVLKALASEGVPLVAVVAPDPEDQPAVLPLPGTAATLVKPLDTGVLRQALRDVLVVPGRVS